ncbi:hypothetical protein DFH94DRAFT_142868 [Russula ochroleuca]|uniref:Uncharacterized protein n=1 Tax=Russula ochroleuca TaxID=152965 RepID=A0A9P5JZY5_9AGAM|nr:hypothetical protein DFH94DRAFT_142868 [Russula ochroleuca]
MCNLETEGTKYGCGTKKLRRIDCNNRYCVWSKAHPQPVNLCQPCYCDKFFGPDAKETVTASTPDYCSDCHYWYRGPGQQQRRR